ncbi:MAG: hypothetical protein A2Y62_18845 [Candidatus Fischerbacteria bacterium RBG_13_37_8]|uniref:Uncharacterized protein n=1 Tax=Candidatus Fischerbacteria bacterium RBG_13_37_8 TaxID=1817863 RepID=A0A1F5VJM9_9BACT|nr:MAG: hypothetical protein A2Y62_18845 [Candidatus Fischerbacteria bacterium RBG_13_37_8]
MKKEELKDNLKNSVQAHIKKSKKKLTKEHKALKMQVFLKHMGKKEFAITKKMRAAEKVIWDNEGYARTEKFYFDIKPFDTWDWQPAVYEEDFKMLCVGMETWLIDLFYQMKGIQREYGDNCEEGYLLAGYFHIIAVALKGILEYSGRLQRESHYDICEEIENTLVRIEPNWKEIQAENQESRECSCMDRSCVYCGPKYGEPIDEDLF